MMDQLVAREMLFQSIKAEMMGPGSEYPVAVRDRVDLEAEIISESPLERYSVGILYEQMIRPEEEQDSSVGVVGEGETDPDELLDIATTTANQYYPSSIGMSFYVSGINPTLRVRVEGAVYRRTVPEECRLFIEDLPRNVLANPLFSRYLEWENYWLRTLKQISQATRDKLIEIDKENKAWVRAVHKLYNFQRNGWIRVALPDDARNVTIDELDTEGNVARVEKDVYNGLKLIGIYRPDTRNDMTLVTLALVNTHEGERKKKPEKSFFQVGFSVEVTGLTTKFLDYEKTTRVGRESPEDLSAELLYRHRKVLGVGHGCALSWNEEGTVLKTEIIPVHEVPTVTFDVPELKSVYHILSMRNLSDLSTMSKADIIRDLTTFVNQYRGWIKKKRREVISLDERLRRIGLEHLERCERCADRLLAGVQILDRDPRVFKAFQLANRAMLMQRVHVGLIEQRHNDSRKELEWPDYGATEDAQARWRPFQLAYLLLNIDGLANPNSEEREIVDLIWFPTGGGKTEAYLGVAAFCIFLRRLRDPIQGAGTAIIMRYTLRLLTSQQFERASTLICACERIRAEIPDELGEQRIDIGLWIGGNSSPNTLDEAQQALDEMVSGQSDQNPFQVLKCPWCGTSLEETRGKGHAAEWGYKIRSKPKRFVIHCNEPTCPFYDELPVKVVDEDIYRNPPTLLFATVDKFALLPWKGDTGNLFGLNREVRSPELIIQDELHLISGPLGTMVGLYETAIDLLCSYKGQKPKIIASTATIRNADEQIKALYNRKVVVFPPAALEIEDSFFSRVASLSDQPGRQYVGIMATGTTMTTAQVRLMSAILQTVRDMNVSSEAKDPYWTLVTYFNTIRELGRTSTLAADDIKDRIRQLARRWGTDSRVYYAADELTGSRQSADIPTMLKRMKISHPDRDAIDILLTTNMISVGIDIDRFGLMMVVSQPKSTAEYIQATSRAGRRFPGLIVTLYDGARPRDRSHYERFIAYHQAYYRYVEPTSVTPFSEPARDRALHAVLVTAVRHLLKLSGDNQAGLFTGRLEGLDGIVAQILERVSAIMPDEVKGTEEDLDRVIRQWETIASSSELLTYSNTNREHLLYPAGVSDGKHFATMQSMRSVDASGNLIVED